MFYKLYVDFYCLKVFKTPNKNALKILTNFDRLPKDGLNMSGIKYSKRLEAGTGIAVCIKNSHYVVTTSARIAGEGGG